MIFFFLVRVVPAVYIIHLWEEMTGAVILRLVPEVLLLSSMEANSSHWFLGPKVNTAYLKKSK